MNRNFQPATHPEPDQLSVFVEGIATAREKERMLSHLAECAECRKAVFLMQPHEAAQSATVTPAKGFIWRPLFLAPAAALACGLIAVFVYLRPHEITPRIPQQTASAMRPEIVHPVTTVAPTPNPERVARYGSPKKLAHNPVVRNRSRQENQVAGGLNLTSNLSEPQSDQTTGNVMIEQAEVAAPSVSVTSADSRLASRVGPAPKSQLPLNGRNLADLKQYSTPADTMSGASHGSVTKKKDLPGLQIERASAVNGSAAGVYGHITDRTGAIIAGVTVTLRDATGKTRQTTTAVDGSFHLTELPAGQYELIAMASGFKTTKLSVELKPSELAMLQPALDAGSASEQVTVEAGTQVVQTESTELTGNTGAAIAIPSVGRVIAESSVVPIMPTVSYGKVFLSLDSAGNLFLSHNAGKKRKKISPKWAGKVVRIELTPAYRSEVAGEGKNEASGPASTLAVFQLTTDANAVWTSKDGAHWHQQ